MDRIRLGLSHTIIISHMHHYSHKHTLLYEEPPGTKFILGLTHTIIILHINHYIHTHTIKLLLHVCIREYSSVSERAYSWVCESIVVYVREYTSVCETV